MLLFFLTFPLVTLQLQDVCQGTYTDNISYPNNHSCEIGTYCKNHWQVAILIATNSEQYYIDTVTDLAQNFECGKKDSIYFMSQSKWNSHGPKCEVVQPTNSNYLNDQLFKYPFSSTDNYTSADTLADIMENAIDCLSNHPLNGQGGQIVLFTNFNCTALCETKILSYQYPYCDKFLSQGYYMTFYTTTVYDNEQCIRNIFKQCYQNGGDVEFKYSISNINFLCNNDSTVDSDRFYTSMLILILATAFPLFLFPLGLLCIRLKQRVALTKKRMSFKRKVAQNEYIDRDKKPGDMWEVNPDNLEVFLDKPLGTGAFSIVYEGKLHGTFPVNNIIPSYKLRSERHENVAVKRPPPHADPIAKQDFLEEIRFMKKLGYHSHILGMVGCFTSGEMPLMVLEYCEQGDLLFFLKRHRATFTTDGDGSIKPKDLLSIAWQISDGLCYLKSLELIHRDLAARNVLITADLTAKISDFGLCRQPMNNDSSNIYISRGGRLPVRWMAPESLRDYVFSFYSDVWSFGIVLWELFTLGDEPYKEIPGPAMLEALDSGRRLENRETIPDCLYQIMEKCWRALPKYRRDIEDLKNDLHEILANTSDYYGYLTIRAEGIDSTMDAEKLEDEDEIQLNRQSQVIHPFFMVDERQQEMAENQFREISSKESSFEEIEARYKNNGPRYYTKAESQIGTEEDNAETDGVERDSLYSEKGERNLHAIEIEPQSEESEEINSENLPNSNNFEDIEERNKEISPLEDNGSQEIREEQLAYRSREKKESTEGENQTGGEDFMRKQKEIRSPEPGENEPESSSQSNKETESLSKRKRLLELPGLGTVELDEAFFVGNDEFDDLSIVEESREVLI